MTRTAFRYTAPLAAILLLLSVSMPAAGAPRAGHAVSFLTGPQEGEPHAIAMAYLQSEHQALGLTEADLQDVVVSNLYSTKHNGVTHVYFQQRLGGIEVYNGLLNVNVAADGSIISLGNRFVGDLASRVNIGSPILTDQAAITRAAEHFGLTPTELAPLRTDGGADLRATFTDSGLSNGDIPVRLVYQPLDDGNVRLAWETVLDMVHSPDWWSVRVDAVTGEVIHQHNWTNHGDSYQVIPFPPYADPEDSVNGGNPPPGQVIVQSPADLNASPFGWHDTNGAPGAESTLTRGNNCNAQEDQDANNSGGFSPDGGPGLNFLFPWDPDLDPAAPGNLEASIVNLFYANNVLHDITHCFGFDEASGNFQTNNYGNGGLGNDEVEADALDGSGTNNANFSTPPDGFSGRMQMFRWLVIENANVAIDSPPVIAGDYVAGRGTWGGALPSPNAEIEIVDDGSGMPSEGCGALIGFTPGNIALIDRGTCEFGTKALNAENAGAVGAIIANDLQQGANGIITMGAGVDGGSVTIPAVMIGNADGMTIRNEIPTVTGTMEDSATSVDRDSDLDNGIIAHELGHGISNRLTGGASNVGCLSGSEQAGEGWSDFWTLTLTAKPWETATTQKGVGNYVIFEPVNGPGIRNFPYTTDIIANPQTYADISSTNVPHGVGEIWMAMVWEMYWELVHKHGFDCNFYCGSGGNNLTMQLVIDGMKMQNCNPTFLDARDAILAADMAANGGANECEIWRAFAKRGAGMSAVDGSFNVGDEVEAFDIPGTCPATPPSVFADGFECGNTERWPFAVGLMP